MARLTLTYGYLPSVDVYNAAFEAACPEGTFSVYNDKRCGEETFTRTSLWEEIQAATEENTDASLSWASDVLGYLGIEWV